MSGALNNVFIRGRGVVVDLDFEARLLEKVREDVTAEIAGRRSTRESVYAAASYRTASWIWLSSRP